MSWHFFAGAGGGILGGLFCGFRTVCAVEIKEFEFEYSINGYKPDPRLNLLSDAILDRLRAFYCGKGEK